MKQKIEELFNLVANLDIDEEKKHYFLEKIWEENFSEKFFDELENFLAEDVSKKTSEISELWEKISENEKKIFDEKEKNFEAKKNLIEKNQKWLKEIYDEAKFWMSKIEGEIDEKIEGISCETEEGEIEKIRQGL